MNESMNKRHVLRLLAWAGLAAVAGTGVAACSDRKPSFNAVDITGADYAKGFTLADADGRQRTLADFKGKVVVMFFGYAQCPDVCPTTMTEMAQVKQQLGRDGDKLQVLFVTVDPERDTREHMADYLQAFDPRLIGLTGSRGEIDRMLKAYRVYSKKIPGDGGDYTMDHTAAVYLLDSDGRLTGTLDYQEPEAAALAKLKRLVEGS